MMRHGIILLLLTFISLLLIGSACSSEAAGPDVNCFECRNTLPDSGIVTIRLSINDQNKLVPIEVYNASYNENMSDKLVLKDTLSIEKMNYKLPVDQYYSVKATYRSGNKTINAIDGEALKTRNATSYCSQNCWIIYGGQIDVTLKY